MSYDSESEPAATLDLEHLMLRHDARVQAALDHARERGLEPSPSMLARVDALRERLLAVLAKSKHRGADSVSAQTSDEAEAYVYVHDDLCALAADGALPSPQADSGYQSDHSIIDELLGLAPQKPPHGPDSADASGETDPTSDQAASLVGLDVDGSDSAANLALLDELFSNAGHEPG